MMKHFPACYVEMPSETKGHRAAFYLAAEEWIAKNLSEGNTKKTEQAYLFTWQLHPTVVIGRNQIAHQEIDIDFCKRNKIDIIRRHSGGGAIFADEGNIMISLITNGGKVEPLFAEYAETVATGLRALGANVEVHGRNDVILIASPTGNGKKPVSGKVCGNAFYHMANRNIVHGTMLYSTDLKLMSGALKPTPQKLCPKGVQSIRARVAMLKDCFETSERQVSKFHINGVVDLRQAIRNMLTDRSISLPNDAIKEIEEIEQSYYDESFLYGCSAKNDEVRSGRIEGCGTVEIHFGLKGSIIREVSVTGDFFETGNAQQAFAKTLEGVTFTNESMVEAIKRHHPEKTIRNLNFEQLIKIF